MPDERAAALSKAQQRWRGSAECDKRVHCEATITHNTLPARPPSNARSITGIRQAAQASNPVKMIKADEDCCHEALRVLQARPPHSKAVRHQVTNKPGTEGLGGGAQGHSQGSTMAAQASHTTAEDVRALGP
jgi:hypothetical protein